MAGTQPHYHISRLKRPKHHKHSQGGLQLETKHRKTGHATVAGAHFEHIHKRLHTLVPQHPHKKHEHKIHQGHHTLHTQLHTSALAHQHRVSEHHVVTHANRHEGAMKALETKKARGEKIGFARLSTAQRRANALKAAATRRREGIKPFGRKK